MPISVIMPKLEMSQESALVVEWKKKPGEMVNEGDALLEVETDKVTVDIEAVASGILAGVSAEVGDTVPVTNVIAYLLQPGETESDIPFAAPAQEVPQKEVEKPAQPSPVAASPSPQATPLAARMAAAEGVDLKEVVGSGPSGRITKADIVARVSAGPDHPDSAAGLVESTTPATIASSPVGGKQRATPAAKRVAREKGVNLATLSGSGPLGRIQEADVQQYTTAAQLADAQDRAPVSDQIVPLKGMRRTIADRLQASYQTAPHIQLTSRVDLTNLIKNRKEMNEQAKAAGQTHISMTAMLVKAVAWALMRYPYINSSLIKEDIYLHGEANVGVAVALPDGLIVPVIKQAEQKTIGKIAEEIIQLTEKARNKQLAPADVNGGTFTISNLGPYGIEQFNAIINPGQTGILAVGAATSDVMVINEEMQIRPIMRITLSVDHRVVDGAVAAYFMADLKKVLELPVLMLM